MDMNTNAQPIPHQPNPERYIRVDSGNITYIVQEKDKEHASLFNMCMFLSNSKDKERAIESLLNNLNQNL